MANNVITNINSKTKVNRFLNLSSLFVLMGYMIFAYMLKDHVNSLVQIPYYIFSFVCAFYLVLPSAYNKGRNNFESIFLLFKNDKATYKPIYKDVEKEIAENGE